MKNTIRILFLGLFLSWSTQPLLSAEPTDAKADLDGLVGKITAKLEEGKGTEADLAEEIKQFDVLLAKHKGETTDDVAQILVMKAMLYIQILEKPEEGLTMLKQIKKDFPETGPGRNADDMIASIEKVIAGRKIRDGLSVGKAFPDFKEKDLTGKPLSVANYKGKVVLIDFWATWCGPCIRELPNVLATYEKYHEKGFEIIGISLDQDEEALKKFISNRKMTWPQFFDGKGWENKLAGQYGITSIPATFLLDGEGKIAGKDLRGDALETAVGKLLAKP